MCRAIKLVQQADVFCQVLSKSVRITVEMTCRFTYVAGGRPSMKLVIYRKYMWPILVWTLLWTRCSFLRLWVLGPNYANDCDRALRIIYQIVYDWPYDSACAYAKVQSLSARRSELGRRFFRSVTVSDSCLHDLLPQRRDSEILSRLRRTLSIQYHELKLINIVLSFTMPWLSINNLTKYCVMIVHG